MDERSGWTAEEMDENPYQTPTGEPSVSVASSGAGCRGVRLSVFFLNCFLLVLFPPTCCPCGFGPIGFIIQPYVILLGCPTILLGFIAPDVVETHRAAFFTAYIINFVVVSYLIGEFAGRLWSRKRVLSRDAGRRTPQAR